MTSVPFDHASPAAMYAHNVHRDDYQDLARDMLGLASIVQEDGKGPRHPGLDVVIGAGYGQVLADSHLKAQGKNAVEAEPLHRRRRPRPIDVKNGGKYVVVTTEPDVKGADALAKAAAKAARGDSASSASSARTSRHLPYRTADGGYRPGRRHQRQGRELHPRRPRREPHPGRHDPRPR